MRIERAIDRFLGQMQIERDWTRRSVQSYRSTLVKLADDYPDHRLTDFEGRQGTDKIRATIAKHWGSTKAATRANRISHLHSFFGWAEDEGFVDDDPSRKIKRPPRRRADVYRPSAAELDLGYRACHLEERAPWLAAGIGLRASTVVALRWQDFDLTHGYVHVVVKGGHRDRLPVDPDVLRELQDVYRQLQPEPDDHILVVEQEFETGNYGRRRVRRDAKKACDTRTFWRKIQTVSKRAGIRPLGPHALRHGFATRFLRDSDRDVMTLQRLMGHTKLETTRGYIGELEFEEVQEALRRAAERRTSVANSGDAEDDPVSVARKRSDGPGWNRTTGSGDPASDAGSDRAERDDEPPLAPPKGGHK